MFSVVSIAFITGLLNNIGTHVDPILLIHRIKEGMEIPNLRDPAVREQYRNNTACTDPKVAGDQLLPSYSKGNPAIDPSVYDYWKEKWEEVKDKK